jgi:hypothetical protein
MSGPPHVAEFLPGSLTPAGRSDSSAREWRTPLRDVVAMRSAPSSDITHYGEPCLAKQQNTFEKRRREVEKKRKAEMKLERRRQKKQAFVQPPAVPVSPPDETPA